jgi:hypothetical protein
MSCSLTEGLTSRRLILAAAGSAAGAPMPRVPAGFGAGSLLHGGGDFEPLSYQDLKELVKTQSREGDESLDLNFLSHVLGDKIVKHRKSEFEGGFTQRHLHKIQFLIEHFIESSATSEQEKRCISIVLEVIQRSVNPKDNLHKLEVNQSFIISSGWFSDNSSHAVLIEVFRESEGKGRLRVFNTGDGIDSYFSRFALDIDDKVTFLEFEADWEKIRSNIWIEALEVLGDPKKLEEPLPIQRHDMKLLLDVLTDCLDVNPRTTDVSERNYFRVQNSGTCSYRCILAWLHTQFEKDLYKYVISYIKVQALLNVYFQMIDSKHSHHPDFGWTDLSEFALDLQKQMIHRMDPSRDNSSKDFYDVIFRIAKSIQIESISQAQTFELENSNNIRLKDENTTLITIENLLKEFRSPLVEEYRRTYLESELFYYKNQNICSFIQLNNFFVRLLKNSYPPYIQGHVFEAVKTILDLPTMKEIDTWEIPAHRELIIELLGNIMQMTKALNTSIKNTLNGPRFHCFSKIKIAKAKLGLISHLLACKISNDNGLLKKQKMPNIIEMMFDKRYELEVNFDEKNNKVLLDLQKYLRDENIQTVDHSKSFINPVFRAYEINERHPQNIIQYMYEFVSKSEGGLFKSEGMTTGEYLFYVLKSRSFSLPNHPLYPSYCLFDTLGEVFDITFHIYIKPVDLSLPGDAKGVYFSGCQGSDLLGEFNAENLSRLEKKYISYFPKLSTEDINKYIFTYLSRRPNTLLSEPNLAINFRAPQPNQAGLDLYVSKYYAANAGESPNSILHFYKDLIPNLSSSEYFNYFIMGLFRTYLTPEKRIIFPLADMLVEDAFLDNLDAFSLDLFNYYYFDASEEEKNIEFCNCFILVLMFMRKLACDRRISQGEGKIDIFQTRFDLARQYLDMIMKEDYKGEKKHLYQSIKVFHHMMLDELGDLSVEEKRENAGEILISYALRRALEPQFLMTNEHIEYFYMEKVDQYVKSAKCSESFNEKLIGLFGLDEFRRSLKISHPNEVTFKIINQNDGSQYLVDFHTGARFCNNNEITYGLPSVFQNAEFKALFSNSITDIEINGSLIYFSSHGKRFITCNNGSLLSLKIYDEESEEWLEFKSSRAFNSQFPNSLKGCLFFYSRKSDQLKCYQGSNLTLKYTIDSTFGIKELCSGAKVEVINDMPLLRKTDLINNQDVECITYPSGDKFLRFPKLRIFGGEDLVLRENKGSWENEKKRGFFYVENCRSGKLIQPHLSFQNEKGENLHYFLVSNELRVYSELSHLGVKACGMKKPGTSLDHLAFDELINTQIHLLEFLENDGVLVSSNFQGNAYLAIISILLRDYKQFFEVKKSLELETVDSEEFSDFVRKSIDILKDNHINTPESLACVVQYLYLMRGYILPFLRGLQGRVKSFDLKNIHFFYDQYLYLFHRIPEDFKLDALSESIFLESYGMHDAKLRRLMLLQSGKTEIIRTNFEYQLKKIKYALHKEGAILEIHREESENYDPSSSTGIRLKFYQDQEKSFIDQRIQFLRALTKLYKHTTPFDSAKVWVSFIHKLESISNVKKAAEEGHESEITKTILDENLTKRFYLEPDCVDKRYHTLETKPKKDLVLSPDWHDLGESLSEIANAFEVRRLEVNFSIERGYLDLAKALDPGLSFFRQKEEFLKELEAGANKTKNKLEISFDPSVFSSLRVEVEDGKVDLMRLEDEILKVLNFIPEESLHERRAKSGALKNPSNMKNAVLLYLLRSKDRYQKENRHLTDEIISELNKMIGRYLFLSTDLGHKIRILKRVDSLEEIESEEERKFETEEIYKALNQKREYKAEDHPCFIVFEYLANMRLRKVQVDLIHYMTEKQGEVYKDSIVQLIMGGGKTSVLAVILLSLASELGGFGVFVTPKSQFDIVKRDLAKALKDVFDIDLFILNIETELLRDPLHVAYLWKKLKFIKDNSLPVITTPESLQILKLQYMRNLSEAGSKPESDDKTQKIAEILKLFKDHAHAIIDEVDLTLDTFKEVNFPSGLEKHVEPEDVQAIGWIFEAIVDKGLKFTHPVYGDMVVVDFLRLIDNSQAEKDNYIFQTYVLKEIGKGIAEKFLSHPSLMDQNANLREFFIDKFARPKELLEILKTLKASSDKSDIKIAKQIYVVKHVLFDVLENVLTKSFGKNYGRLAESESAKVIPYAAVDTPTASEFGYYPEAICYHMMTSIQTGVTKAQLKKTADIFFEQAKRLALGLKKSHRKVDISQKFRSLFGFFPDEAKNEEKLTLMHERLEKERKSGNFSKVFLIEKDTILEEITYHEKRMSSNAHSLLSIFASIRAFSGTPWNIDTYPLAMKANFMLEEGVEGAVLSNLIRKRNQALQVHEERIHILKKMSPREILAHALDVHKGRKERINMLLDPAAQFKNLRSDEVAFEVRDFLKDNHFDIKGVLFFSRPNKMPKVDFEKPIYPDAGINDSFDYTKSPDHLAFLPINSDKVSFLPGSSKEALESFGLKPNEYFVVLDERHTTGTNIYMPPDSVALMTFSENLTYSRASQAIMRLRQYSAKQDLHLMVPESLVSRYKITEDNKLEAILSIMVKAQATQKEKIMVKSYIQKIDNATNSIVFEILTEDPSLYKSLSKFVNSTVLDDLSKLYETEFQEVKTKEFLLERFDDKFKKLIEVLKGTKFETKIHTIFLSKREELLEDLKQNLYLPPKTLNDAGFIDIGVEIEQFVEVQVETEVEVEAEVDIQKELEVLNQISTVSATPEKRWTERYADELLLTLFEKESLSDIGINIQSFKSFFINHETAPLNISGKPFNRFSKAISDNLMCTENFSKSFKNVKPILFARTNNLIQAGLLLNFEQEIKVILLSQLEVSFWREYLKSKQDLKDVWLFDKSGALLSDGAEYLQTKASFEEVKKKEEFRLLLIEMNAIYGNVAYLSNSENKEALHSWLETNRDEKLDLVKLSVLSLKDRAERKAYELNPTLNPSANSKALELMSIDEDSQINIEELTDEEIQELSDPSTIRKLPKEKIKLLANPFQIESLVSNDQVNGIENDDLIKHLNVKAISFLAPEKVIFIGQGSKVNGLITKMQVNALDINQIRYLSNPKLLKLLEKEELIKQLENKQVRKLNLPIVGKFLTDKQIEGLEGGENVDFGFEVTQKLTHTQIAKINQINVKYVPLDKLHLLPIERLDDLSDEQIRQLDKKNLIEKIESPNILNKLMDDQLNDALDVQLDKLSAERISQIKNLKLISRLSNRQIEKLQEQDIGQITHLNFVRKLQDRQLKYLNDSVICSLDEDLAKKFIKVNMERTDKLDKAIIQKLSLKELWTLPVNALRMTSTLKKVALITGLVFELLALIAFTSILHLVVLPFIWVPLFKKGLSNLRNECAYTARILKL